jgi:uncharacterized membrane protein
MTIESTLTGALTRSQTVFMVTALVLSVVSFMLNAPAIRDINTHLGAGAFGPISSYFYLAGAIANAVLIRWSD